MGGSRKRRMVQEKKMLAELDREMLAKDGRGEVAEGSPKDSSNADRFLGRVLLLPIEGDFDFPHLVQAISSRKLVEGARVHTRERFIDFTLQMIKTKGEKHTKLRWGGLCLFSAFTPQLKKAELMMYAERVLKIIVARILPDACSVGEIKRALRTAMGIFRASLRYPEVSHSIVDCKVINTFCNWLVRNGDNSLAVEWLQRLSSYYPNQLRPHARKIQELVLDMVDTYPCRREIRCSAGILLVRTKIKMDNPLKRFVETITHTLDSIVPKETKSLSAIESDRVFFGRLSGGEGAEERAIGRVQALLDAVEEIRSKVKAMNKTLSFRYVAFLELLTESIFAVQSKVEIKENPSLYESLSKIRVISMQVVEAVLSFVSTGDGLRLFVPLVKSYIGLLKSRKLNDEMYSEIFRHIERMYLLLRASCGADEARSLVDIVLETIRTIRKRRKRLIEQLKNEDEGHSQSSKRRGKKRRKLGLEAFAMLAGSAKVVAAAGATPAGQTCVKSGFSLLRTLLSTVGGQMKQKDRLFLDQALLSFLTEPLQLGLQRSFILPTVLASILSPPGFSSPLVPHAARIFRLTLAQMQGCSVQETVEVRQVCEQGLAACGLIFCPRARPLPPLDSKVPMRMLDVEELQTVVYSKASKSDCPSLTFRSLKLKPRESESIEADVENLSPRVPMPSTLDNDSTDPQPSTSTQKSEPLTAQPRMTQSAVQVTTNVESDIRIKVKQASDLPNPEGKKTTEEEMLPSSVGQRVKEVEKPTPNVDNPEQDSTTSPMPEDLDGDSSVYEDLDGCNLILQEDKDAGPLW